MSDCQGCKGKKELFFVKKIIECPFCKGTGKLEPRPLHTDLRGIYSSSARFMNYEEGNSYAHVQGEYWDRLLNRFK